jgi:hypothetical protein
MQLRNHFVLPVIAGLGLSFLVGCGGSPNKPIAPPSGGFTNANLKGTYVFSIVGADNVNGTFLATTGTFTANGTGGSGGITGGAIDMNDPSFSSVLRNNPITGGSYTVTADGRGQATLLTATPFGSSLIIDFVLSSSSHGLVTQFDGNGSGSGTLDLQTAASQPAAGNYVFGLSGISGVNVLTGGTPLGTAGLITLDGSGNATGSLDYNNNETPSQLTINSGSKVLVSATPGTATLVTSGGTTLNFDVYAIDATHMKLIEVDSFPILSGDVFSQTSASFPSGQIVFTMAGLDFSVTPAFPLVVGGLMTSDGTSTISNGKEDFNDAGTADSTPQTFAGTISSSGGRTVLQLTTFENGAGGVAGTFTFAAYPSSGGIQLLEIDGAGVSAGVAFAQSSTSLSSSQGYGLNLTAANSSGFEEDDIAEFVTTSSSFSGLMDINDQGQTSFAQKFNGSYSLDSPATGRGVLSGNLLNGAFYVVDSSNVLLLETDANQLGLGAFSLQAASAQSNMAAAHLAMLRSRSAAKAAWHRRQ